MQRHLSTWPDVRKSQIALQVSKLASADVVEKERAAWKKAFEKLGALLK